MAVKINRQAAAGFVDGRGGDVERWWCGMLRRRRMTIRVPKFQTPDAFAARTWTLGGHGTG